MFYKRTKQARTSRLVYNSTQKRNHIGIVPDVKAVKGGSVGRTEGSKSVSRRGYPSLASPVITEKKTGFQPGKRLRWLPTGRVEMRGPEAGEPPGASGR